MDIVDEKKLKLLYSSRDKELERIKSLGVVSVLNKSFKETAPPPRPLLSPSDSLTTDNPSADTFIIKSRSLSYSSSNPIERPSSPSLHNDYYCDTSSMISSASATKSNGSSWSEQQVEELASEREDNSLVTNSSIDTEKETLEKRVQELEALYTASVTDLQILESRSNSQKDILILQDKLIHQMSNQLDTQEIMSRNMQCQICSSDNVELLLKTQQDVVILTRELDALSPQKSEYSSALSNLTEAFTENDHKIEALEQLAQQVQKTNTVQMEFIDIKIQTLLDKILLKNEMINKLEQDQQKQLLLQRQYHQQLPPTPSPEMIRHSDSITSLSDSSAVIWENKEHDIDHGRQSYTARWKRNAIPPASPPPSLPLPPIPSASSRSACTNNRPQSILSEISRSSSLHAQHISMGAVGGNGGGLLGVRSEFDQELADAAYYKEFTNQLQERLSVSKEIDNLRIWGPADYDSLQRKMGLNKNWSDSDDGHNLSSQKAAFWKGMKKKLKV